MGRRILIIVVCVLAGTAAALTATTYYSLNSSPLSLRNVLSDIERLQVLDRHGQSLSVSYQNRWNHHDTLSLYEIPALLQQSFIASEDKRFYEHSGVDWQARLHALFQNIKALRKVRGASTITEQVARLLHPRPRTLWSRWLEGWEASALEKKFTKAEIFEFYLNQVPYASNRRGVLQAARYYFNRDLETLSPKEILTLVVLVRAPSRLDPYQQATRIEEPIKRLAAQLREQGILQPTSYQAILDETLSLEAPHLSVAAKHFIHYARQHTLPEHTETQTLRTSLEASLQRWVQDRLDQRLQRLKRYEVRNGAVLIADHQTGHILAWAVAGSDKDDVPGRHIDAVTTPRQPGSTLKPFVYGMALESGWTAATLINDSPLTESLGHGLHSFQNYSRLFYGPVTLREALGNSLNIPAIRTIRFVGVDHFFARLLDLGITSLRQEADYYGDGLALGNGEISLFELVQAYTALANRGHLRPLHVFHDDNPVDGAKKVMSPEISSLIANILSDPEARQLEFGRNSVLRFPVQTAVKTGTSSDYRDAWSIGFNHRYVVGIWMGNLDQSATKGLTGSRGPTLLLRSIFSHLNEHKKTRPLYLSPRLVQHSTCIARTATAPCVEGKEWFVPGTASNAWTKPANSNKPIQLLQPTPGLHLARDPRIPDSEQAFEFLVSGLAATDHVTWWLNRKLIARTNNGRYLWPLQKGEHLLYATIWRNGKKIRETEPVHFSVR